MTCMCDQDQPSSQPLATQTHSQKHQLTFGNAQNQRKMAGRFSFQFQTQNSDKWENGQKSEEIG